MEFLDSLDYSFVLPAIIIVVVTILCFATAFDDGAGSSKSGTKDL